MRVELQQRFSMSQDHVSHQSIVNFADERVNLKRDDAKELRRQANTLRERLDSYLGDHPQFELRKMMLSGSLAKSRVADCRWW
jgi:hypothetical protein